VQLLAVSLLDKRVPVMAWGVYGALTDTFWDLSGTAIEKTMGGYFKTWKISR
jgi:hypothetical protein